MARDGYDLGLSLSLAPASDDVDRRIPSLHLASPALPHKMTWSDLFPISSSADLRRNGSVPTDRARSRVTDPIGCDAAERGSTTEPTRPFLKGIDVNRAPVAEREMEEDVGVSSPNSTVSSVSGKRGHREESENERACSAGGAMSDEDDAGEGSRKKLRLSKDQSAVLEESFKEHNTLNPKQKMALAKQLNLRPRQVEVWFQNRRARTKLKQTEVDCEFLKRCCENLTEENRRLQKEVQELRTLKLSPQFYMHMTPPTTLTMCPSCERVSAAATAGAAPTSSSPISTTHPTAQSPNVNGNNRRRTFFQQHHPVPPLQHRPTAMGPNTGGPVLPWAPMPLHAGSFLDAQPQRS